MNDRSTTPESKPKWYRRPGCIIALVVFATPLILIVISLASVWFEIYRPTYYEKGIDFSLDKLPQSAHDVRFSPKLPFAPNGRTYEFKCSESDFIEWVKISRLKHPKLSEIREIKYEFIPTVSKDGVVNQEKVDSILISDWRFEDQGFYLAYDRGHNRAVKWSHSR